MRVRLTVTVFESRRLAPGGTIFRAQGRWRGKPVKIRRGPATVTGDARRTRERSHWGTDGDLGRRGGKTARKPGNLPRPKADIALAERGGSHASSSSRGLRPRAGRVRLRGAWRVRRHARERHRTDRGAGPHAPADHRRHDVDRARPGERRLRDLGRRRDRSRHRRQLGSPMLHPAAHGRDPQLLAQRLLGVLDQQPLLERQGDLRLRARGGRPGPDARRRRRPELQPDGHAAGPARRTRPRRRRGAVHRHRGALRVRWHRLAGRRRHRERRWDQRDLRPGRQGDADGPGRRYGVAQGRQERVRAVGIVGRVRLQRQRRHLRGGRRRAGVRVRRRHRLGRRRAGWRRRLGRVRGPARVARRALDGQAVLGAPRTTHAARSRRRGLEPARRGQAAPRAASARHLRVLQRSRRPLAPDAALRPRLLLPRRRLARLLVPAARAAWPGPLHPRRRRHRRRPRQPGHARDLPGRMTVRAGIAVAAAALAAVATPASATTPRVDVMVVGKSSLLQAPTTVAARATKVRVGRRSCTVATGTPLGALAAVRRAGGPPYHVRDFGSCSRRAADAGGLFVDRIGSERNAGSDGWVYKVGRKAGTTSAADPSGPFGTGRRLRTGQQVLWHWCTLGSAERCPPTLSTVLDASRVTPGAPVRATVTAYDDDGHGTLAAGATIALGGATATAGPDGSATLAAPAAPGSYEVTATASGDVTGFPAKLEVG